MTILKAVILGAAVKAALKVAAVGFLILAFVDPAWAVPVQTFLLIVLTLLSGNIRAKVKRTERRTEATHTQVIEAKANATHAASAAAAAAAVARDSNRIVKDVGAAFRAPRTPHPEEDDPS